MLTELAAFVPVAAVVICTPGPDTALTIRNALTSGRSLVVARARALFDRPRIRRGLDALTGCVLIGLGVRLAAEQR